MNIKKLYIGLYYALAIWLPSPPFPCSKFGHFLRRYLCNFIFKKCGANVVIGRNVNFGKGEKIQIGEGSNFGRNSWIANDTVFGKNVMTGPEIIILSYNHSFQLTGVPFNQQGYTTRSPIIIGDNVWIGTRTIILPGVHIGNNTVIGAGSVVTKSIPSGVMAAGNPAKIIKEL